MIAAERSATPEGIREALREVLDPEYPISLVDLGLIRGIEVSGARVDIKLTYTCMGCPAMEMIQDDIRERLLQIAGVERVQIEVVWDRWSRDDISAAGIIQLHSIGVV
jgi:metal-sulfur cluster biosynthetic enzyme